MKYILLTAAFVLSAMAINAQNFHWLKPAGGANSDYATETVVAPDGRVFTFGYYSATVDFDPGPGVVNHTSLGVNDVFLTCFSPSGTFLWAKSIGGTGTEISRSISVDAAGAVYIAGAFTSTSMDIDPGPGSILLTNVSTSTDCFIIKYNASGNLCWGRSFGGSTADDIFGVDVLGQSVVLTGSFTGTADLDPGAASVTFISGGAQDAYLTRLDTSGTYVSGLKIGGTSIDEGHGVCIDNSGNVVVTGSFAMTVDFDPSAGTTNRTSNGSQDAFVVKYDLNSMFLVWVTTVGGVQAELPVDVEIDALDNIYFTGNFFGNFDINAGSGTNTMYWAGSSDIFASKLDATGTYVWGWCVGGGSDDEVRGMSLDGSGDIYFTGGFVGTSDFNPGSATNNLVSNGSNPDIFVLKMTTGNTFVWTHKIGASNIDEGHDIYATPNDEYFLCGRFNATVDFDPGAGVANFTSVALSDAFTAKYSICPLYTGTISASTCSNYTSPSGNHVYTTSGTYLDTMQSIGGCDSLITITLTVLNATSSTISASTCASGYTSPSGNYVWNTAGTYMDTIANVAGCDSIITVNLTITAVDVSVTNNAPSLTANQAGATYQWLNCDSAYAVVPGATAQTFVATVNGNYACAVTFNSCTDTSACESVMNTSITSAGMNTAVTVYPNPNNGDFTYVQNGTETVEVIIYDALGQIVKAFTANPGVQQPVNIGTTGIYTITTVMQNGVRSSQRVAVTK